MISKKMITNGFKKEIDINQTLNEFYIKTVSKLDISTYFKINYNDTVISDRLNYYLFNDDYDISDEKYYLYKFKFNDYYFIEKFIIEVDEIYSYDIWFEYEYDNSFTYNNNKILDDENTKYTDKFKIIKKNYISLTNIRGVNHKLDTQISLIKTSYFTHVKIYNTEYDDDNYDLILEENLEVIRKDNTIKIKIPDRYLYNFNEYGCEVNLKGDILWDQHEGHNPLEEIKVL
jgi:hypothetical protein